MRSSRLEAVQSLLHASAAIVWIASADGEFVELQPAWEEYTGQRWEEYRGSKWLSAIHPDDRAQVVEGWTRAVGSGSHVYRTQGRIWSARHESWRAFQARAVPARGPDGNIVEWVGALTDVQDAVDAARKKDEFLAMLGHELRNPLAPIVTATSLIRARGGATSRELDVLERQARYLARLVDDLLDASRATSGKLSLERRRMDLADVLSQAIESTAPMMEEKGLQLDAEVDAAEMIVEADRERLLQVITNVLVNAAKFTPAGGAVFLTAGEEAGEARVTVRDEGQGIPADLLPHVFDPFTQGQQGVDRRSGGLGLGLAIARSIVLAHGGRVDAASPGPGQGTTITVCLPLVPSSRAAASSHEGPEEPAPASGKHRVLIVDDNADSAEMLARFLELMGYDPFVAGDARDALAISREVAPDDAILDIGLPDLDGYELAHALREAFGVRAPKLIALTGYAEDKDRKRALASGFAEHMAKPVDMTRLASALQGLLVSSPCRRQP